MALTSSGCGSLDARLDAAAVERGRQAAGMPDLRPPEDCARTEPHATIVVGAEVRSVLKRERAALDRQNARTQRCHAHAVDLANRIGGATDGAR